MESVSQALFSLFRGTPQRRHWLVACLEGAWPGILGEKIAGYCRPLEIKGSELFVEVLDAAWLPVLSSMRSELLDRIRAAAGNEVQKLSLVPALQGKPDS